MCLNSIVLHTDSSQGLSTIRLKSFFYALAATVTTSDRGGGGGGGGGIAAENTCTDTGIYTGRTSSPTSKIMNSFCLPVLIGR